MGLGPHVIRVLLGKAVTPGNIVTIARTFKQAFKQQGRESRRADEGRRRQQILLRVGSRAARWHRDLGERGEGAGRDDPRRRDHSPGDADPAWRAATQAEPSSPAPGRVSLAPCTAVPKRAAGRPVAAGLALAALSVAIAAAAALVASLAVTGICL